MFAENLGVFIFDMGVECSANGHDFLALRDLPDETLAMAGVQVQSTMPKITVAVDDVAAASLSSGDALTVDGQAATVRDVMSVDDGAFFHVTYST